MAMKLRSLECLLEVVVCNFNLSQAAKRLYTSQPAITRQIQLLEQELGFEVLLRLGNRIGGLTTAGEAVYARACNIIHETRQLGSLSAELGQSTRGRLVIATTHVHARYTLLPCIKTFRTTYPDVAISVMSGDPSSIAHAVVAGQADFGLSAEATENDPKLITFPCYSTRRLIITPKSHPLMQAPSLSLETLAQYPLIVYDKRFSSGWRVLKAFEDANITPNIVLTAIDAEVLKAYVAAGLGIAVIQALAFDPAHDLDIEARDPGDLFECPMSGITLRRGSFLRGFTVEFLKLLAPGLDLQSSEMREFIQLPPDQPRR